MGKDRKSKKGRHEEDFGEEGVDSEQLPLEDESNISQASANKRRKAKRKDLDADELTQKVEELSVDTNSAGNKLKSSNKKADKKTDDVSKASNSEDDEKEIKKSNKKTKKSAGRKSKVEEEEDIIDSNSKSNKKKGRRVKDGKDEEEEEDDDEQSLAKEDSNSKSNKKKGRRVKDGKDEDDDDFDDHNKSNRRKLKGKKGNVDVSDDDDDEQSLSKEPKTNKKARKLKEDTNNDQEMFKTDSKMAGKKNKESDGKNITLDDDDGETENFSKKKNKKDAKKLHNIVGSDDDSPVINKHVKSKSVFEILAVEDDMGISDDEDESDKDVDKVAENLKSKPTTKKQASEEQDEQQVDKSKEGGKKSKKKEKRRKQDDDDEEVQKMLEELALEIEGKKPSTAEKEKEGTPESNEQDAKTEDQEKSGKQKKKRKKKGETDIQPEEKEVGEPKLEMDGDAEEQSVKTAAQRKKEKKEREKQKKLAQNAQERKKTKDVSEETIVEIHSKPSEAKITDVEVETASIPEDAAAIDEADDEADSKKKKKKKKKGEEDDKKDKKRPGKKQILLMQEALKKVKEEEEKRKLEEEAKLLAAEEAERKRQEQLRLEQEKKERKKQKEKEKRERLKAEGKLLTKAQKQARARMEATLSALRLQGVEVPQIGEKRERAPRLGDRRKPTKKKLDEPQSEQKEMSPSEESPLPKVEVEIVSATENEEKKDDDKEESIKESWDDEEDVKEAWDETTDDEGEEDGDKECSTPEYKDATSQPSVAKKEESEESDEEEEDESESEEDESEEESSEESNDEEDKKKEKIKEKVFDRIQRRREEAEKKKSTDKLRSPVVCVLGHVDTGKTKILDKIRRTHVQDNEAGGITQQIGATMVPQDALKEQCKMVKNFPDMEVKLPGLLIIDTPGHESFSNLRSRGSSLCDIAILVVDIMHGLEPQTLESINLLKQKKTPFVVALNKIDRLYDWKSSKNKDIQDVIKSQARNTKIEYEERVQSVVVQFAEQGLNAALSYENKDTRTYISMVPTSAFTGEGMGNLMALIVELSQTMMAKRLAFSEELQATVLEVKAIPGLGTTIDVILVNGMLREGDTIVVAGQEGPVVTQIRSLLMPEPLKELRVKNPYNEYKEVEGAQGVKIAGKDLEKAIAGLQLLVAYQHDEVELLKEEVANSLRDAINSIKLAERGVYVQASTLGSLEALLDFLRTSKIPYSGVKIGPVVKKDVMKASIMLEHETQYAVILAFDVKVERDAEELAESLGVKIFQANIIYHLFDRFTAYQEELQQKKRDEYKHVAVFPCKLRILPQYIFNSRDPIVLGVSVEAGVIREGTPLCVPSREFLEIGTVTTLELNHKNVDVGRKGQEICIKIEPLGGESPKMYGRHFDNSDILVSKITRQSIDACKNYFRDDLQKSDWQLMVELKKLFQIM